MKLRKSLYRWRCWLWAARGVFPENTARGFRVGATPWGGSTSLTLILLTWRIWWSTSNANRWHIGFIPYPANVEKMVSS